MGRRGIRLLVLLLLILLCVGTTAPMPGIPHTPAPPTTDITQLLGAGSVTGYARAERPRSFHFPTDFGPHPAFRTEWWYFTGNLDSIHGRRFGYELSFFRFALIPTSPTRTSRWGTNQVYMAHFAIADPSAKHFHYFQKLTRGAVGLAGAQAAPFRVWVDNWSVQTAVNGTMPWRLHAAASGIALDLDLNALMLPVLQGDHGLSRKSAIAGNASYYYSIPRLATRGTLSLYGRAFTVNGLSWMDREWSTSALESGQAGWDWFALQLSDGSDLMYYRLRRKDGSVDPYSQGSLIDPSGRVTRLAAGDVRIQILSRWSSPHGGIYPARWHVQIKTARLALDVRPILADQELDVAVRYWEGAVDVSGTRAGVPLTGRGYIELTGYARTPGPRRQSR